MKLFYLTILSDLLLLPIVLRWKIGFPIPDTCVSFKAFTGVAKQPSVVEAASKIHASLVLTLKQGCIISALVECKHFRAKVINTILKQR